MTAKNWISVVVLISSLSYTGVARSEVVVNESTYEGRPHFVVKTECATYFYDQQGGGMSRMLDREGNDWIAFHCDPLSEFPASAGAGFRGIPNLVFGADNPDAGAGHPGFDRCQSECVDARTIRTRTKSGRWEWTWRFTDTEATLTIIKADPAHPYWFLYEGPIGGKWSPETHFFGTDQIGLSRSQPGDDDQLTVPMQWAYFGDDSKSRVLLALQREADELVDNVWYLGDSLEGLKSRDGMMVFGFGRDKGSQPLLRGPGHQFRIAFVESISSSKEKELHDKVAATANAWLNDNDWPTNDTVVSPTSLVQVTDEVLFHDMECFKITTPSATYVYGKRGAGFASILDAEGNDWISYRPGGLSQGEYRGLPKSGQPTKFFHCGYGFGQYKNENPFISKIEMSEPNHVRIRSVTLDDKSACTWDFFPGHATMTLDRIGNETYWFLYEGTPGGKMDSTDDYVVRPGNRKTSLNEPWLDNVPWAYFVAKESGHGFYLIDHQSDPGPESYVSWPYTRGADNQFHEMTVFGFGRPDWQDPKQHTPPLTTLPARFSIGFSPTTRYDEVESTVNQILSSPLSSN
jgi:hypothetical protein